MLASLSAGKYLPTQALAEFHGVPKEYLSKALQELSRAGIVEGRLGPRGGYRLARPPESITFLDIVEAVEGGGRSFECTEIRKNSPCAPPDRKYPLPCHVARVMQRADAAWRQVLRETRLSHLQRQLQNDLPLSLRRKTAAWLAERSGS